MEAEVTFYRKRLLWTFLATKLAVFAIAFSCALFLEPYNPAISLLLTAPALSKADEFVLRLLRPFASWDGAYFLSIARDGYIFEQQHAFLPLYPMLVRFVATWVMGDLGGLLSPVSRCLISAVLLSNLAHFLAVICLFSISTGVFLDPYFSFVSACFATIYPMQAVLASAYSESLFMLLTMLGMRCFYQKERMQAALAWSLAGLARSNGILLPGFFVYEYLHGARHMTLRKIIVRFFRICILIAISWSGFVSYIYYGYSIYCAGDEATRRPWCQQRIPNVYSFVQDFYWNVGFLRYFRIHQLPNFILALPMIYLSLMAIVTYCGVDWNWTVSLGLLKRHVNPHFKRLPFHNRALLPHVFLLAFMLSYAVLVAHVQIINRLFTFMPVIYWYQAHLYTTRHGHNAKLYRALHLFVLITSTVISCVLFFAYYPPA